jgi:hypothetical protein
MTSQTAGNQPQGNAGTRDALKRASQRLKQAQAEYSRFQTAAPIAAPGSETHSMGEMLAAQKELQSAEEELRDTYARYLREDLKFQERSQEIEQDLAKGPPWEDRFSPSETLRRSGP